MKCWWFDKDKSCSNEGADPDLAWWPFCGEACHKRYSDSTYKPKNERGKPKLTIKQMQDKLLEMGQETGDQQKKLL